MTRQFAVTSGTCAHGIRRDVKAVYILGEYYRSREVCFEQRDMGRDPKASVPGRHLIRTGVFRWRPLVGTAFSCRNTEGCRTDGIGMSRACRDWDGYRTTQPRT